MSGGLACLMAICPCAGSWFSASRLFLRTFLGWNFAHHFGGNRMATGICCFWFSQDDGKGGVWRDSCL